MEFSINERPVSTTTKLAFPFYNNPKGLSYKFDTSFYKSYLTNNRMSEELLNNFFTELYMAINHFGSLTLYEGSMEKLMFRYTLGIFIIVGSLMIHNDRDDIFETIFLWISCCIGLLVLVNSLVFLLVVIRQKTKAEQKLFLKMQKIIEKNNKDIQPLGLSWRLSSENFRWIDLELNSKYTEDDSCAEKTVLFFQFDSSEYKYFLCDSKHQQKTYNPDMTDNRLAKSELDSFLHSLAAITHKHNYGSANKRALIIGLCLVLEIIVFVSLRKQSYSRLLYLTVAGSLYVSKYFFGRASEREYILSKAIKSEISELITQKRQHFSSLGLRWHLAGDDFTTIDLWLDYKYTGSGVTDSSFTSERPTEASLHTSEIQINMDSDQLLLSEHI